MTRKTRYNATPGRYYDNYSDNRAKRHDDTPHTITGTSSCLPRKRHSCSGATANSCNLRYNPTSRRGLIISAVDRYGNSSRTILSRYSGSNENGFDTPGRRIHTKAIRESCRRYHNNNTREVITTRHDRHDRKTGQYRTNRYRKPETTLSTSRYRYNTRSRDNVLIDRFDPNCNRYDSSPTSSPGRIYSNCRDTGRSAESPTP